MSANPLKPSAKRKYEEKTSFGLSISRIPGQSNPPAAKRLKSDSSTRQKQRNAVVDTEEPLRDGTPQATRNKALRGDAMAAIARDATANRPSTPEKQPPDTKAHRRRSSRGHRVSMSFEGGAFTLPHTRVHEESFYKHVDREVPPSEQVRQLLVWSASRAAAAPKDLPPEDTTALEGVKNDLMRWLAEHRIDLAERDDENLDGVKGKNAQNEKNMGWEQMYSQQIADANAELEEWRGTKQRWKEYIEKQRTRNNTIRASRGDQRADERYLDERFRRGLQLARAPPDPAIAQLRDDLRDLQPTLDVLHTDLHSARTAVRVASRVLDARFGLIGAELDAREGTTSPGGLLRALTRVDAARPPERISDEARQAAREVQRAVRAGEGERRLTATLPGTPSRRSGTPRRDRTPVGI